MNKQNNEIEGMNPNRWERKFDKRTEWSKEWNEGMNEKTKQWMNKKIEILEWLNGWMKE
jgi:hypothetical protein